MESTHNQRRFTVETAVIVGAGFSRCAGLYTTDKLAEKVFLFDDTGDILNEPCRDVVSTFMKEAFNWSACANVENARPSLEDVFTVIDLSANSGHSLGPSYSPARLRAIRRILIHRIFVVLNKPDYQRTVVVDFLKLFVPDSGRCTSHFVVLNWDSLLERYLILEPFNRRIDYRVQEEPWNNSSRKSLVSDVAVAKVHGSANWVYCECCRRLFADLGTKLGLDLGNRKIVDDLSLFDHNVQDRVAGNCCSDCGGELGPHIATFSFRKSFRTHAFMNAWLAAEQILTLARKWVFVGYSLPDADYEFKHLLKSCELKRAHQPDNKKDIEVVVADEESATRYQRFFGIQRARIFDEGIEGYVKKARRTSS